ncbi:hypothetical protein Naga_100059g11 [Nannochloropsis gaditana]|uniref:VASt domain-containing protein n=1 Tax=Nannochloropsis gaditana TaxID=72520 RepID=W7TVV8_9STRA|nr:hypothetical protein Naga_100059g11 [Nannochloropsis gaditana]
MKEDLLGHNEKYPGFISRTNFMLQHVTSTLCQSKALIIFFYPSQQIEGDRDVSIQPWSPAQPSTHSVAHHKMTHRTRTIVTKHPVKAKMPGIPSHVRSTKTQVLSEEKINRNGSVIIRVHETNEVEGVPFADRFLVAVVWTATWTDHTSEEERKFNPKTVRLTVHQHVIFRQSFLLEKMVERDSRKETLDTVKLWSTLVHQQVMASEGAPSSTPLQGGDEGQEAKARRDHECILMAVTRKVLVTGAAAVFILLVGKTAFYLPDELARLARCRRQKPKNQ